ncbi:MAG: protein kinase [Polyangiales bacterium]
MNRSGRVGGGSSESRTDGASLPPGTVVSGKFRVLGAREPGDDEFRYKALHLGTGRRVELRLLGTGVTAKSPEATRLLRAARAAGKAPHVNVLNVVDSGLDAEQRPFVVYEQFGGAPSSELVARSGPCDARLAVDIVGQVLDGLTALHARGVFHRQLRAESVLVDGAAEELRVKLVGLGYAGLRGQERDAPELPRGYSRYLAPEARRGDDACSPAIDVYAAGVLLRFLLSGDSGPRDAPSADAQRAELLRAVERATSDEPDERFQTAAQFRACIASIVGPSARESLLPSSSLLSDLRFLLRRRAADEPLTLPTGAEDGRLELFAVLLMVESLYAKLGPRGWAALLDQLPELEQLLPAAGRGAALREEGVPHALVARMLRAADQQLAEGKLRAIVALGEELARRGLDRFCAALPAELTPELLVACVPVLWRSIARAGDVTQLDQRDGHARIAVRAPHAASLELSALFAGLLRGQLRAIAPAAEVNLAAAQALGDAADILSLSW